MEEFWENSTTVWPTGLRVGNRGGVLMGDVGSHHWQSLQRRGGYRRLIPMPPSSTTKLHSSLQPGPLWNCVWRRRGVRGYMCPIGSGRRKACNWRECGQWIGRHNRKRGRRIQTWQIWRQMTNYVGGYCRNNNLRDRA